MTDSVRSPSSKTNVHMDYYLKYKNFNEYVSFSLCEFLF